MADERRKRRIVQKNQEFLKSKETKEKKILVGPRGCFTNNVCTPTAESHDAADSNDDDEVA